MSMTPLAPHPRLRRTRLVATIGPASVGRLRPLMRAGLDVARINLSHGSPEEHRAAAAAVRDAAQAEGRHVALLVDLPGPKLRLGRLPDGELHLEAGTALLLAGEGTVRTQPPATPSVLPLRDPAVLGRLEPGDRILLADGEAECRVTGSAGSDVRAEVVRGGRVRSGAGVSVPAERLPDEGLAPSDAALLPELLALSPDLVGQSFVRSADDVGALRERLPRAVGLVAKIETRPAVEAIEAILELADAIMVARGDLGVELPFEEVPLVQKDLVAAAGEAARPVIVATQMLESMVEAPRPTRAEASDVANAVIDGADAVMLSAETAIGAWPVEALEAAATICLAADARARAGGAGGRLPRARWIDGDLRALAAAAVAMAQAEPGVVALACYSRSGRTARALSAFRPDLPILAFTHSPAVARALSVCHGIVARVVEEAPDRSDIARAVRAALLAEGQPGDAGGASAAGAAVVLVGARPAGRSKEASSEATGEDHWEVVGIIRA